MSTSNPSTHGSETSNSNGGISAIYFDSERYASLANQPCPVPADVIEKVKTCVAKHISPDGKLLNLYIWGSRFYLNHTSKSDWDLVAIVTGYDQPKVSNVITVDDEIDVGLCEKSYFEGLLEDHVPWAVAFAYYPPCGIIFENLKLVHHQLWRQQKRALSVNSQVNLNQAAALWRHGDEYKARKRVFFILQMTIFASQLVLSGRIYDFWEEPNTLRKALFDPNIDTWAKFDEVWRPIYEHYVNRFIELRNAYRIREIEYISASIERREISDEKISKTIFDIYARQLPSQDLLAAQPESTISSATKSDPYARKKPEPIEEAPSKIQTLFSGYYTHSAPLMTHYILRNGLHSLSRDLAVTLKRHPRFPNLIHFTRTPMLSPVDSVVAAECHGMLVDENDRYRPVAWSHDRFYKFDEEGLVHPALWDPASIQIYQNPDAILVELYHYGGEWNVATTQTPDGSETFASSAGRTLSELFWETWYASTAQLTQLDPSISYSFWLQHPLARQRVTHKDPCLLLEGGVRWGSEGLFTVPMSDISRILPFSSLTNLVELRSLLFGEKPSKKSSKASQNLSSASSSSAKEPVSSSSMLLKTLAKLDPLVLPIGGLLLQHGADRNARVYVPCMYMKRIDNIERLEGDQLPQELEWLRLLVEQPNVPSAWQPPPSLHSALPAFQVVSHALKELIDTLEKYLPKLPGMTQAQVLEEANSLGDVGHFVFLLKGERTPYNSVRDFLKYANQRRVRKYLTTWWTRSHSTAPPRQSIQYSYK